MAPPSGSIRNRGCPFQSRRGAQFAEERYDLALQSCDRAIAIDPAFADAWNNGNALNGLGRVEEALQSYERALALKPDYPAALNNRGNALRPWPGFDGGTAKLRQGHRPPPAYADTYYNRGVALEGMRPAGRCSGEPMIARSKSARLCRGTKQQGKCLATLGRRRRAASLQSAISLKPDYADAWRISEMRSPR